MSSEGVEMEERVAELARVVPRRKSVERVVATDRLDLIDGERDEVEGGLAGGDIGPEVRTESGAVMRVCQRN